MIIEVKLTINLSVHFMASNIDKRKEDDTEIDGITKRFITAQPHFNLRFMNFIQQ